MPKYHFAIIGSRGYPSTYGGYETFVRHFAPWLGSRPETRVTVYNRREQKLPILADNVEIVTHSGIAATSLATISHGATGMIHAAKAKYSAVLVLNIANSFFLPTLKVRGIPSVVNTDGLEWERDKWNWLGKRVFESSACLAARWADHLVADSEAIGDYWRNRWNVPIHFIPYGAEVNRFAKPEVPLPEGLRRGKYVLVVARLVPENNLEMVTAALRRLAPDVPIAIVGTGSANSPAVQAVNDLKASRPSVKILGHISDQGMLTTLLHNCAVYIHGHSVGGTNPILLQALGNGSPTIIYGSPYNEEVIEKPWPTFLDVRELVDHLNRLLEDEPLRRNLSDRGRDIVSRRYTWPQVFSAYEELLQSAARRERSIEPNRRITGRI